MAALLPLFCKAERNEMNGISMNTFWRNPTREIQWCYIFHMYEAQQLQKSQSG